VHGDNIRVSWDGTVARRAESFCKGVTFSSRPIKVAEKVSNHFHLGVRIRGAVFAFLTLYSENLFARERVFSAFVCPLLFL
jgi:hypothetical protein